jgi:hypothetical protein
MSPRNKVGQSYPRPLGSLYVVYYGSQGYGGGILTLPLLGGPGSRIYIPQGQSDPVIPPGTGFPLRGLLDSQGYGGGILTLPLPEAEAEVNLRPTVCRPVCLGVRLLSGTYNQIFLFCLTIVGFLM